MTMFGVVLVLFCATSSVWSYDGTTTKDGRGAEVVDATVEQLRSICMDDKQLLNRMAWALTRFGDKNGTFDPDALGGIWNVTEKTFNESMFKVLSSSSPFKNFAIDKLNLSTDVKLYRNGELRKPLHSAFVFGAAMNNQKWIDTYDQMLSYNTYAEPKDQTRSDFLGAEWTKAMESYPKIYMSTGADVAFVMDLSPTVDERFLEKIKDMMMKTISGMEIAADTFRVAVYVFCNDSFKVVVNFNDIVNNMQLMKDLDPRSFSSFYPVTNDTRLSNVTFLDICNRSLANPTIFVFINDQNGSSKALENVAARNCGIQRLEISISPRAQTSDVVSSPSCVYSYKLKSSYELHYIPDDLTSRLCHTYATQPINVDETITAEHSVRGDRYFYKAYRVFSDAGLTFSLVNVTGQSTLYLSTAHLPNANFYTHKIGGGQQLYIPTKLTAAGEPVLIMAAIKGVESNNRFKLKVAYGDQRKSSAAGFSAVSVIWLVFTSFILLVNRI